MRIIFSRWTYEEFGRPMPGRAGGHPLNVVSPQALPYDTNTQQHLDIDDAVNAQLCADIMARSGAYWIDAQGDLCVDPDWRAEA